MLNAILESRAERKNAAFRAAGYEVLVIRGPERSAFQKELRAFQILVWCPIKLRLMRFWAGKC